jgi:plasmanylethanolamine desaturase
MTIANFTECLINDSNSSLSIAASYSINNNNENSTTLPTTAAKNSDKCVESSIISNNEQNKTMNITQNLGYLKKMRSNAVKTGRNTAGAKYLAGLYTKRKRMQECIGISVCLPLIIYNSFKFIIHFDMNKWYVMFFAAVIGILTADFISGIVHWAADSYGSVELFLVGKSILRNFREHHIDPTAITRHDFIETNGDNLTVIIPILAYTASMFILNEKTEIITQYNWHLYLFFTSVFLSLTNQFHKWSHTYFGLPRYISILQELHIILPRIHHRVHHVTPHDTYFCITTGWLNYPLELISFWQILEHIVFVFFGTRPRTDDMKWALKTE